MPRLPLWCCLLLLVGLQGCDANGAGKGNGAAKRAVTIPVVTAKAERRELPLSLGAIGTVESTGTVAIQSRVDGQIVKVLVRDGDEVKAGQALLEIDPVPYRLRWRSARATLAGDEAKLANTNAKLERARKMFEQHYISSDELTQLETDRDAAAAAVEQSKAAFDSASVELGYTTLKAPVAGKLGHIATQVGSTVRADSQTPITTLNVLDHVDVTFSLPQQQLSAVRSALTTAQVSVQPAGQDATAQTPLTSKISFIDNTVDVTTGTIRLRARFDNAKRILWPGEFVPVTIDLPTRGSAIVVPSAAIAAGPKGSYLYVIDAAGKAEQRAVEVLRVTAGYAIVSGVQEGESIVVDGQSRLSPGAMVRVQTATTATTPSA